MSFSVDNTVILQMLKWYQHHTIVSPDCCFHICIPRCTLVSCTLLTNFFVLTISHWLWGLTYGWLVLQSDKHSCYLLGDLNINLLRHEVHRQTADFLDIMYSNGFIALINRPTRVTAETATVIDHIYSNNLNATQKTIQGILVTDITDHYPVFHFTQPFSYSQSNNDDTCFYTRRINQSNMKFFKYLISQCNWTGVINESRCNDAFNAFYSIIKSCYYQAFPLIRLKTKYAKQAPWVTNGLRASITKNNKLYKKLKRPNSF